MQKDDYRALALRVLDRLRGDDDHTISMNAWEWPSGVALYGIWKTYSRTGDADMLEYLINWYDVYASDDGIHQNVNTVGPMLALTFLYEHTRDERYLKRILYWAEWVMREMPRTEYGGLQHCTVWNKHFGQLWADTLFMCCLFLCKAGLTLNRPEWVEEAKYQFLIHIKYLQNKVTGLWYHGWTFDLRHNYADAYWARGNAWFTCASVEILEMLGYPNVNDAACRFIASALEDQGVALWKYQHENGRFNTLIDVEECYCETSASAGIAYGLLKASRLGIITDERLAATGKKAAEAVLKQISDDGAVQGVSGGTGMGRNLDYYKAIKLAPTAYGQGLTFLMLVELQSHA